MNGPIWGEASDDLNATILEWDAGGGPAAHVNEERDVVVAVLAGALRVETDDGVRDLEPGDVVIVAKGARRKLTALAGGTRYLSVHRRRPPLQVRPLHGS